MQRVRAKHPLQRRSPVTFEPLRSGIGCGVGKCFEAVYVQIDVVRPVVDIRSGRPLFCNGVDTADTDILWIGLEGYPVGSCLEGNVGFRKELDAVSNVNQPTDGGEVKFVRRRQCRRATGPGSLSTTPRRVSVNARVGQGLAAEADRWWARQDSNLRPRDYESPALTN